MKSWEHPADAPGALRAFNEELKALSQAFPTALDQLVAVEPNGHIGDPGDHCRSQESIREHLRDALGEDVFD